MNLFAYGTLMWPEVLEAVVGRRLEGCPADLAGYRRLRIKGEHYPAIIPSEGDLVQGLVYCGLTVAEFDRLDRFEGEEYDRVSVAVCEEEAQVYVLAERWRHLAEPAVWQPEDMQPGHLEAFCREYKGWQAP